MSEFVNVQFVVPRQSSDEVTVAVVTASVLPELREECDFLTILKRVVTVWINSTPEGQQAWKDSHGDFNVGDLSDHLLNPDLTKTLASSSISDLNIVVSSMDQPGHWQFDDVLRET